MKNNYYFLFALIMTLAFGGNAWAQFQDIPSENLKSQGSYEVATITNDDGLEDGLLYRNATIYYPVGAKGLLPTIAIVPGFFEGAWAVKDWGPFYASHGIVAVIIDTYTTLEFPTIRATALLEVLETMKKENTRKGSPLNGALDLNKLAVSGHSMGGGGAQIAANLSYDIKAVVALNPWLSSPLYFSNESDVLILAGGWDSIAPSEEHAFLHYEDTSSKMNKALVEFRFGTHFVGNSPKFNGGDVGEMALAWLKLFLDEDDSYCSVLENDLFVKSFLISTLQTSYNCSSKYKIENPIAQTKIKTYPNPAKETVYVQGFKFGQYELLDREGHVVAEGILTEDNNAIDVNRLTKGIYILHIDQTASKIIVQ